MKMNELDWVESEKSKAIFNWFYNFYLILAAQENKNINHAKTKFLFQLQKKHNV